MNTSINNVDYLDMPGKINTMKQNAEALNVQITKAYDTIANMHDDWYGKRYNELVKSFNEMIPQINDMLTLVVTEIPNALGTIANNYAQADSGKNAGTVKNTAPKKIRNITIRQDVGLHFVPETVSEKHQQVLTSFNKAKDEMNKFENNYTKIKWSSTASEAFKSKFTKLKKSIISSFDNVSKQFGKLMTEALNDMKTAENKNTVK